MSSTHSESDEAITQINVVPLVDIMLVLLIIFMLTASFISSPSIPVHVPKAYSSNLTIPASQSLVLAANGDVFYLGRKIGREDLGLALKAAVALNPELRVVLSADETTPHGKVVELLDLARSSGVVKIALGVTQP